ncbi:pyridoxal-dependent decarboxylase, exosortase A system-associated [Nocardioides sp. T2.26MG-1]|uniref:pyridoxal-dependent decarboxylase, exosortase A system-associated n=1 Tax=Nocardioides sp. T2.26MG-1 TaxID=3041166 RepID=UPI00247776D1|nr:pyridoxal-dependent decarboxylase, exosortase A system-associated [Nocardioides sp. T2.26MG-1]CAI9398634.1 L-glutamyl-[BtrI acyl-carrier protein] decarboxylase [Nocardioides sp. T2.26MG-1]
MTPDRHVEAFDVKDGQLVVGGMPLERLAAGVGSTPFFAYDRRLLTSRVESLRAALPGDLHLGYAVKANPMPAVVQHLAGLVDVLDVASAREMRTALDTGIDPGDVSFAGPGKTEAELRQAAATGVVVEVESRGEVDRLLAAGEAVGVRPVAAIRVNPDFAVQGSGMRMGGGPQQFGVDAEQVPELLGLVADRDLDMVGFHVFAGSQNLDADILAAAQERTVDLVLRLADHAAAAVRYVNLGGGFGIPYFEKDQPLDLARLGENLHRLLETRLRPALPEARAVVELGRYIVGEAGVYVTRVVDTKVSRGQRFAVVDGGMHHQLAASGNLGQVIRRNYPLVVGTRLGPSDEDAPEPVTVVGCLCTPLDLLGSKVSLPTVEVGDLVVVFQAGAYGLTASPTAFLGHDQPVEVLV